MLTVREIIGNTPIFAGLEENELQQIEDIVVIRNYKKNMIIFMEGEPGEALFFIISGKVKVYKLAEDGREQILHILKEGDVFAEVVFIDKGNYPATAQVLEDSQIGLIRNDDFERLVRENPDIALSLLRVMTYRLRQAQIQIRDIALRDTYGRVASMLLMLAKEHGLTCAEGIKIDLSLSRQELANLIGTTRETVTRVLSDFNKSNIIRLDRQVITILDEKKLRSWM
ncbi:CarD family transcriptional regulator [Thermincola ferriacetica]|uniref:CarD family transcriptional regulator n=1 Tax=Thermincola ferriacetica TaxID=281456 RepID=A0A0L6VZB1_9FIRM|nr:Crp/Fnr family transcriptional regulator [Thermincola ferriacetica]KNZ68610.1 CarD family transcriptional regulator [Thermincola ferriacetica]